MTVKRIFSVSLLSLVLALQTSAQLPVYLQTVWSKCTTCLLKDEKSGEIVGLVNKGDALILLSDGYILQKKLEGSGRYRVRTAKGDIGYVYKKYLCMDEKEALARYMPEKYDSLHRQIKDRFGGGKAIGCEFYPREKADFPDRKMPVSCYSLYLNCSVSILSNIDAYIALAKRTKINTFVIDIKEDGAPGFKAEAMKRHSPTAYTRAGDNEALYRRVVEKLHAAGMWAVGRIVCFKDYHLTKDHPEYAIWDKRTDAMLLHNKSHWPSAYNRKVWEYNVSLACESVRKLGFDEINFDYVRFPDRMNSIKDFVDMRNVYGESKVQAIQRFVTYAADMIHAAGAYLSIDVFGECANPGYTTPYGQYWPAISNVADVICGMPYPDHFSNGYYGINKPWNHPYEILYEWGKRVQERQAATPSPAIVRTWVQAYHVLRFVDPNGIDYNAENISREIRGLYDAGLTGGYATWLASGSLEKYCSKAAAFNVDYYADWLAKQAPSGN